MAAPNDLVLYHYKGSPYANRIVWYLALRNIDYAECLQPMIMPRPDLEALNVKYRRIPVLAHGNHVYCDTRLIIEHLEQTFPASQQHPSIYPESAFERSYVQLLEKWAVEAGIFANATQLLPPDLPALKDPRFQKDRQQMSGRSWSRDDVLRNRGAAMIVIRDVFLMIEEQILGDGRQWILGNGPSIAEINLVWPLIWLVNIPGALDDKVISAELFPKAFAWIKRFEGAAKGAQKKQSKPTRLAGPDAAKQVLGSKSQPTGFKYDSNDPTKLKLGDHVEAYPADSGVANRDYGRLVGLDRHEAVLETKAPTGEIVYIHHPRRTFKIRAAGATKL